MPVKGSTPLTRADWIAAGLAALREAGPDAVAVQPLATRLDATKGSFYWHFRDRPELLAAVLEQWRAESTTQIMAEVDRHTAASPREKLRRLLVAVTRASTDSPGEQRILAGCHHPAVQAAVAAVTAERIAYVEALLRSAGLTPARARRTALIAYTWYLGQAQLIATVPALWPDGQRGRRAILDHATDLLLADLPEPPGAG